MCQKGNSLEWANVPKNILPKYCSITYRGERLHNQCKIVHKTTSVHVCASNRFRKSSTPLYILKTRGVKDAKIWRFGCFLTGVHWWFSLHSKKTCRLTPLLWECNPPNNNNEEKEKKSPPLPVTLGLLLSDSFGITELKRMFKVNPSAVLFKLYHPQKSSNDKISIAPY